MLNIELYFKYFLYEKNKRVSIKKVGKEDNFSQPILSFIADLQLVLEIII